jgi:hypothetical protein
LADELVDDRDDVARVDPKLLCELALGARSLIHERRQHREMAEPKSALQGFRHAVVRVAAQQRHCVGRHRQEACRWIVRTRHPGP